jgi:hypothetical protein
MLISLAFLTGAGEWAKRGTLLPPDAGQGPLSPLYVNAWPGGGGRGRSVVPTAAFRVDQTIEVRAMASETPASERPSDGKCALVRHRWFSWGAAHVPMTRPFGRPPEACPARAGEVEPRAPEDKDGRAIIAAVYARKSIEEEELMARCGDRIYQRSKGRGR